MSLEIKHDPNIVIATAQRRLISIDKITQNNQVYLDPNPVGQAATRVLARLLVGRVNLVGQENLDEAKKMSGTEGVMYIGNHHSNADTPVRREAFTRSGLKVFVDSSVYLAGLNVAESSPHLFPSERAIQVVSPRDIEAAKWVSRNRQELGLSDDCVDVVLRYLRAAANLNGLAYNKATTKLGEGFDLFFYPEATRSRDEEGRMGRAHLGLSGYLQDDNRVLVPIYESGSQRILPPNLPTNKIPKWLAKCALRGGEKIEIIIGEPIWVGQLQDNARTFSRKEANVADIAMYQLWRLKSDQVMPSHRDLYSRVAAAVGE